MGKTSIEWCDFSINPIRARDKATGKVGHFCEKISPGCKFCYASRMQGRFGTHEFTATNRDKVELFLDRDVLAQPLKRKKPTRYFPFDMTDLFYDRHPDEWLDAFFAVAALTPQHTYMVLTKRAERMQSYFSAIDRHNTLELAADALLPNQGHPSFGGKHVLPRLPLPNVWLGVSVEDQQRADERIPHLLRTPAAVRFLSVEPLLGPVDIKRWLPVRGEVMYVNEEYARKTGVKVGSPSIGIPIGGAVDWVIVGGESGHGARPCDLEWVRSVVQQCRAANTPVFVKQLGSVVSWSGTQGGYMDGPSNVWPRETGSFVDLKMPGRFRKQLCDKKGGDPSEWPEDIRIRQFPEVRS